jgi:hypothetical protein
MQRRIKAHPQETANYQALIDHKQATLNVILAQIPDPSTFGQLGELMGLSHEWVRQRLVKAPNKLYKIGKRYLVPKGVAEDLVRSVFVWSRIPATFAIILLLASSLTSSASLFVSPIQLP